MSYKNHHQIYTHSIEHGIIIGQYWSYPEQNSTYRRSGRVMAITETGRVILQSDNLLIRPVRPHIDKLKSIGTLETPVVIFPYERVNKTVGIQVMAFYPKYDLRLVIGELRREYSQRKGVTYDKDEN